MAWQTNDKQAMKKVDDVAAQVGVEIDSLTQQLADMVKLNDLTNGSIGYGKLTLPKDFPRTLPFSLSRSLDGEVVHDFDFDLLEVGAGAVHVKGYSGAQVNDGLTESTAVQAIGRALEIANTLPQETVVIYLHDDVYDDTRWFSTSGYSLDNTLVKNIVLKSIAPSGRTVWHSGLRSDNATWIADEHIHYVSRTACYAVIDNAKIDEYGAPLEYEKTNTLMECKKNRGSWFTDGTLVYVNTSDGRKPDSNIIAMLPKSYFIRFGVPNGKRLVMRNINVLFGSTQYDCFRVQGLNSRNNDSQFYAENCVFGYARANNGCGVWGIDSSYLFNCVAHKNAVDGFNYHLWGVYADSNELVFEYNCKGFGNGTTKVNTSSNATTAHDGLNVVRVGCVGSESYGAVLADTNGCYSVNIDCKMGESTLNGSSSSKASYLFNANAAVKSGKAYLINCEGGSVETKAVYSDGNIPIHVKRFSAQNLPLDQLKNLLLY